MGNQLFQYAYIRHLQKHNPEQKVCYHFDEVYQAGSPEDDFINALKFFKVKDVEENGTNPKLSLMQKILLLEDDLNLNRGIALLLSREGYEVRQVYTIKEAKEAFQKGDYALVISDITLPDGTGLDFGRMVRAGGDTYLIYLTALDQEIDIVNGYDTGADDYITKPFSLMALVSKVNALMRRLSKVQAQIMSSGEITVHMKTMQVYKGDEPVTLSKKEFSLLLYLWENAGQIVSKESILEHVWDIDGQFVDDNTVTVNISRLKNKLGTEEIANVRGLGYIWTGKVNKN